MEVLEGGPRVFFGTVVDMFLKCVFVRRSGNVVFKRGFEEALKGLRRGFEAVAKGFEWLVNRFWRRRRRRGGKGLWQGFVRGLKGGFEGKLWWEVLKGRVNGL